MQTFRITEELQNEFVSALQNDKIANFLEVHHDTLVKLAALLKNVKIPKKKRSGELILYDKVCIFICTHFMELLGELGTPNTLQLPKDSIERVFLERLVCECLDGKEWSHFYKCHEQFFETIIMWARQQHVVNCLIERNQQKYLFLEDARLDINRVIEKKGEVGFLGKCFGMFHPVSNSRITHEQSQLPTAAINNNLPVSTNISNATTSSRVSSSILSDSGSEHNSLDMATINLRVQSSSVHNSFRVPTQSQTPQDPAKTDVTRQSTILRRDETRRTRTSRHGDPVTVHRTPTSASQKLLDSAQKMKGKEDEFERKLNVENSSHRESGKVEETRKILEKELIDEMKKLATNRITEKCQKWEEHEEQWTLWLKLLETAVTRARSKFMVLMEEGVNDDMKIPLLHVHLETLNAYDLVYKAFFYLKSLSEQVPEKVFLRVLMKNVQEVCDNLHNILQLLGTVELQLGLIRELFDACGILSTWKLWNIANKSDPQDYEVVDEPMRYGSEKQTCKKPNMKAEQEEINSDAPINDGAVPNTSQEIKRDNETVSDEVTTPGKSYGEDLSEVSMQSLDGLKLEEECQSDQEHSNAVSIRETAAELGVIGVGDVPRGLGPSDSSEDVQHSSELIRLDNELQEELSLQDQKHQRELHDLQEKRRMIQEESRIMMEGRSSRRATVQRMLEEHQVVLFYTTFETEEANELIGVLTRKSVPFHRETVDFNAEVRLGIKEYTRKGDFPQLLVHGNLVNAEELQD